MCFSEKWFCEWVNLALSIDELVVQIIMVGLEVDSVELVVGEFSGVVVVEIISIEWYLDVVKLQVCLVNVGDVELL